MSYDYLNQIIPSHRWMIYVYNSTASASGNSWRCNNCFVSYNYKIPYSILVIGVPYSTQGNPSLLQTYTSDNTVDAFSASNDLVDSVYDGNLCLQGVFANYGPQATDAAGNTAAYKYLKTGIVEIESKVNQATVLVWSDGDPKNCRQP